MPQQKGRRLPTPQFQTKTGRTLLAYYSSPTGRQGHGICIGGWGWHFCEDWGFCESAHEKGDEINYKQQGEVTTQSNQPVMLYLNWPQTRVESSTDEIADATGEKLYYS